MTPDALDISRRRLFQLMGLGAVGATGIAACSPADEDEPESDESPGAGQEVGGEFRGAWPYVQPPEGHFNAGGLPYAPNPTYIVAGSPYNDLVYIPSGYFQWEAQEWVYLMGESSELDVEALTFTLTIKPDLVWSNGDPITAEDLMTTMWCAWLRNSTAWQSIESLETTDDRTLVVHLKNPSAVIERYLMRACPIPTSVYGEWATQAQALFEGGKDQESPEFATLSEDFTAFKPEELVVSGPFTYDQDNITSSELHLIRNDTGYGADVVRFAKVILYWGETPDVAPLLASGDVDYATHGFTPAQIDSFIAAGYDILRPPNFAGPAILFNLDKLDEFKDKRARQAIAHAIDRAANGSISMGESGVGVELMAGFSDVLVPEWVSEADQGNLNTYAFDRDQATTLLEDAGWEMRDGKWFKPNGDAAKYGLQYQSNFADYSAAGDDAVSQLNDFGFDVSGSGVVNTDHDIGIDKGNFELAIHTWGSSSHPHPHFSYVQNLFTHNIPVAANQGGKGMAFELQGVETDVAGTVDLEELTNLAGSGLDEEEQKANVTTLALVFNELLPMVPLWERYGNNPVLRGERVEGFPEEGDPILNQPVYGDNQIVLGILTGDIQPVAE